MKTTLAALALVFALAARAVPQQAQEKPPATHNSVDPKKCKRCAIAYEKACAYLKKNHTKASFAAKMVIGWLFLADGRFHKELEQIVKEAMQWADRKGNSQHAQNWYPALAGILLAEYYKYAPTAEVQQALVGIVKWFTEKQERTGGWFKWFEGAYTDRLDYPVKDLGMLTSIIYGFLWTVKTQKIPVDDAMMKKADDCLLNILTDKGIGYGSVSRGGDKTGARGAFVLLGLDFAGQANHKIYKTYVKLLPKQIPNLDQGHHIGAFHGLGVTLGCHKLGTEAFNELVKAWLDKLIDKQGEDGSLYIGDDGDAGGEPGLLKGNHGSTAAFALMILMQDPKVLRPTRKK